MDSKTPTRAPKRSRNGTNIRALFARHFGFSEEALASVGTLFLAWSLFENDVEVAIWKLTEMPELGKRPATDKMQSSERIRELTDRIFARVPEDRRRALDLFRETAEHVLAYRNAIAHGRPFGGLGGQFSASNFSRKGELRKRPPETAYLQPNILNLALEAMETLCFCVYVLVNTPDIEDGLVLMLSDPHLQSARSAANEARHIASMINNEKY